MKTLACRLTAVVSLALAIAGFGASAQERLSGTVISSDIQGLVVETATKERVVFHMEAGKPKVGEKVTVYYDASQRDHRGVWFAMNVEKAGKTDKGSKKRSSRRQTRYLRDVARVAPSAPSTPGAI
jgi:hypothetical protein